MTTTVDMELNEQWYEQQMAIFEQSGLACDHPDYILNGSPCGRTTCPHYYECAGPASCEFTD